MFGGNSWVTVTCEHMIWLGSEYSISLGFCIEAIFAFCSSVRASWRGCRSVGDAVEVVVGEGTSVDKCWEERRKTTGLAGIDWDILECLGIKNDWFLIIWVFRKISCHWEAGVPSSAENDSCRRVEGHWFQRGTGWGMFQQHLLRKVNGYVP